MTNLGFQKMLPCTLFDVMKAVRKIIYIMYTCENVDNYGSLL